MNIIRNLPNFEKPVLQSPQVDLERTHAKHFDLNGQTKMASSAKKAELGTFGGMVMDALNQTSNQILDSQLLQQQAIVSPDSVDPSTLVVSMLKADMSLSMTKAVVDRATTAYKELTTVR